MHAAAQTNVAGYEELFDDIRSKGWQGGNVKEKYTGQNYEEPGRKIWVFPGQKVRLP